MNTYLLILNKETLITIHYIFFIILGYVLGSIMFGYLIPKIFKQVDTKKDSEDGNPGTANAFIQGGMLCGICTLLLELGKGFVPVYLAKNTISPNHILFSFIMLAPVVGHAYPLYSGFKGGGKCIAVSFGSLLGLFPYLQMGLLLAFWLLFFSLIIIVKPHTLRIFFAYFAFILTSIFIVKSFIIFIGCFSISMIVGIKHLASFRKMEETEVRFAFRKL